MGEKTEKKAERASEDQLKKQPDRQREAKTEKNPGKKAEKLRQKQYLAEKAESRELPRALEELTEKERRELEQKISGRITQWLELYLKGNPQKRKQVLACLEKKTSQVPDSE